MYCKNIAYSSLIKHIIDRWKFVIFLLVCLLL
jgi:hypothetical protein